MMVHIDENGPQRVPFVKVPLVDQNAMLTDVLLETVGRLPSYRKRLTGKGKNQTEEKSLSQYSIDQAKNLVAALSDPRMQEYLGDPTRFFSGLGETMERFQEFRADLAEYHTLFREVAGEGIAGSHEFRKLERRNGQGLTRGIKDIRGMDLDGITQNQDDVSADNRREIDYFRAREKLFDKLREEMGRLSEIDDPYERVDQSQDAVMDLIGLKDTMDEVLIDSRRRRLRKDKAGDNEYWQGSQHGHGTFVFERAPTPKVKMDEVIGKTFATAKRHLDQVVETGTYSRFMQMTAPGHKVRSNILLIGPYGCGKTELARAVCADPRVIGADVNVTNTMTAYMHESVNNVGRVYDACLELRADARDAKPVVLVLDEFNGWFAENDGHYASGDMKQIETTFLGILDGMKDYPGIITMAMTNEPLAIPKGILRRFRYVDVVGELDDNERAHMLHMWLDNTMPVHEGLRQYTTEPKGDTLTDQYGTWAKKLKDAPGDVIRKVADEVHFALVPELLTGDPGKANGYERTLTNREAKFGSLGGRDVKYVKQKMTDRGVIVTPDHVNVAMDYVLGQPSVQTQIKAAKKCYEDAHDMLDAISNPGQTFGFRRADSY